MRFVRACLLLSVYSFLTVISTDYAARLLADKPLNFRTNFILERDNRRPGNLFTFDKELGWRNNSDTSFVDFKERYFGFKVDYHFFRVTLDQLGYRLNPNSWKINLRANKGPILAIGDSFTFGDEVSDDETWPHHLQAIQKVRVINGGVNSYGLDQIFLKLSRDLSLIKPKLVVLSTMSNTLKRTTVTHKISSSSCYTRGKPFFLKNGGALSLRERDEREEKKENRLKPIRSILGHSFILHTFFSNWFPRFWSCATPYENYPSHMITKQSFQEVSCLILEEIRKITRQNKAKLMVLGQAYWSPRKEKYERDQDLAIFLNCAEKLDIPTINIDSTLEEIYLTNYNQYQALFFPGGHMTNQGNILVAQKINRLLSDLQN